MSALSSKMSALMSIRQPTPSANTTVNQHVNENVNQNASLESSFRYTKIRKTKTIIICIAFRKNNKKARWHRHAILQNQFEGKPWPLRFRCEECKKHKFLIENMFYILQYRTRVCLTCLQLVFSQCHCWVLNRFWTEMHICLFLCTSIQ